MTLQGFPAATLFAGISRITTLPAPITVFSPMDTPGHKEHGKCEFLCFLFSPELFQSNSWFYDNVISPVTENPSCSYLLLDYQGWQNTILEQLDIISCCYADSPDGSFPDSGIYFDLMQCLNRIMKALYENLPSHDGSVERESAELISLKNMIRYIDNHFAEHITLQDISSAGTCCKSKCFALFRKYLCDTPISYMTKYRLRKSLEALLNTDRDMTDIALACGFGGTSYYCETFRKYYGTSPLQYRKSFTGSGSVSE